MSFIVPFLPVIATLILSVAIIWGVYWGLIGRYPERGNEQKFPVQLVMMLLMLIGVLAFVMTLPLSEESRSDVMRLIGIVLSGIIAFSSTNILANLMAGVLLRIIKPFATGDFIRVGEFFGRVSQRGLFDTEIQSEARELITIPNTYLVKNPITTTPNSGAIVSVSLSLGYDVHHSKIEPLLIKAADESGLERAFVHILELGDFSVTYRISGLLAEVKGLITARSNLFRSILDVLHQEGIEIVSPSFMNQRKIGENEKIIPAFIAPTPKAETAEAEEIVFDKAEQSEQVEKEKEQLVDDIKNLEIQSKEAENQQKETLKEDIEVKRQRLKEVKESEKNTE